MVGCYKRVVVSPHQTAIAQVLVGSYDSRTLLGLEATASFLIYDSIPFKAIQQLEVSQEDPFFFRGHRFKQMYFNTAMSFSVP